MKPVVVVPVVADVAGVQLPHPLTPRAVRRGAQVALQKIALVPGLEPVLDAFLGDRRLTPSYVASIAGELLAEHGITVGDEVPQRDYERVLTAAMRKRRGRLDS